MTRDEQEHLWELAQDPPADDSGVVVARFSALVANAEFARGMRRAVEIAERIHGRDLVRELKARVEKELAK